MGRFKNGDTVFFVESKRVVRKATVVRTTGNLYLIRFTDRGGTQVSGSKLYPTEEEAKRSFHRWNYSGVLE